MSRSRRSSPGEVEILTRLKEVRAVRSGDEQRFISCNSADCDGLGEECGYLGEMSGIAFEKII